MKIYTIFGERKKTGKCSVFVQIWLNRERVLINTKVDTDPLLFDTNKGHIEGKSDEVKDNNLLIEQVHGLVKLPDINF